MRSFTRRILARLGYVKASEVPALSLTDVTRLKAADAFVEQWTNSGLAGSLIDDYMCTLGCSEAETYADLFRAYGYTSTADGIISDHTQYDECGDSHHMCEECADDETATTTDELIALMGL
ncbi:hypothetical protein [Kitasatospora cineracea]|uniref:hypothetical protein n=1 Tax=Kitasatospora cineracea TaxID=88074 RepID=UPI0033E50AB4